SAPPFDTSNGALFRASLLRTPLGAHVLVLHLHHLVSDAWSEWILHRDLAALYDARRTGGSAALPELSYQYVDFATWQRARATKETVDAQVAFWRAHLEGAPPAIDLPTDKPRPPMQTHRGAHQARRLGTELRRAMTELAKREGASPFMVLFA